MKFADPFIFLIAGWLIPAVVVFFIFAERSRRKAMERFAGKEVLGRVTLYYDRRMRLLRVLLTVSALAMMIVTLARPQWSYYWKENKKKGIDIVVGVDTSKSMLCNDIRPDRLEFVKTELGEFVKKLKGDRVGLIAFSGSSFLQCPLTVDYKGYVLAVNGLSEITISRGGTAISSAIREAVRCYRGAESPHKIFILISDGEHHEGDIEKAIALAKKEKIRIFCIGVGTLEGGQVYTTNEAGTRIAVKDADGKPVVSRLNEQVLRKVASETGGAYRRATEADFGLAALYEEHLSKLEKRDSDSDKVKVYQDRFQYTAAIACLLLIAEMVIREKNVDEEK